MNQSFSIMVNMVSHLDRTWLFQRLDEKLEEEIEELKETIASSLFLDEASGIIQQGRTKIIKIRIRGGKVQRRKKFSSVKGYTIRGGKMVRMSQRERIKRKLGQRKAKIKRRAKLRQALRKRRLSLRRRKVFGA